MPLATTHLATRRLAATHLATTLQSKPVYKPHNPTSVSPLTPSFGRGMIFVLYVGYVDYGQIVSGPG